jgi:hypothetical protein
VAENNFEKHTLLAADLADAEKQHKLTTTVENNEAIKALSDGWHQAPRASIT